MDFNRQTYNRIKVKQLITKKINITESKTENFVLLTQYCAGDKIKKNEMGWACGMYG